MVFVILETTYRNQSGNLVATQQTTTMLRSRINNLGSRQMPGQLYWNNIEIGDEVEPLKKVATTQCW